MDGDTSSLMFMARALVEIETLHNGRFKSMQVKGNMSKLVLDMLLRLHKEGGGGEQREGGLPL